jgi:hypothetical protein
MISTAQLPLAARPLLARAALLSSAEARSLGIRYRDEIFVRGVQRRLIAGLFSDIEMPALSVDLLNAREALSRTERRDIGRAAAAAVRGAASRPALMATGADRADGLPGPIPRLVVGGSIASLVALSVVAMLARDQRLLADPLLVMTALASMLALSVGAWELCVSWLARRAIEGAAIAEVARDRTGVAFPALSDPWDGVIQGVRQPPTGRWERIVGVGLVAFMTTFLVAVLAIVGDPGSTIARGLFALSMGLVVACFGLAVGLAILGRRARRRGSDDVEAFPFEDELALAASWRTARIRRPILAVRAAALICLAGVAATAAGFAAGYVSGTMGDDRETTAAEWVFGLGVLAVLVGGVTGLAIRALVVWRSDDRDLRHRWTVAVAQMAVGIPAALIGSFLVGRFGLGPAIDSGESNALAAVVGTIFLLNVVLIPAAAVNIVWTAIRGKAPLAWAPPVLAFGVPIMIGLMMGSGVGGS